MAGHGQDAVWALDFFSVRTANGVWLNVPLVIDLHTKEILELRACDAWGPTAERAIKSVRLEMLNRIRVRDKALLVPLRCSVGDDRDQARASNAGFLGATPKDAQACTRPCPPCGHLWLAT